MKVPVYKIMVENRSGRPNTYIVSQDPPQTNEGASAKSLPLVITRIEAPPESTANFTIHRPSPYFAWVMISHGEPSHGVATSMTLNKAVKLGEMHDGTLTPGTTLQFDFKDRMPNFSHAEHIADQSGPGTFAIQTSSDFTRDDIRSSKLVLLLRLTTKDGSLTFVYPDHMLIGVGDDQRPWSAFAPEPAMTYTLQPKTIFYLYAMNHEERSILDVTVLSEGLKLDFTGDQDYQVRVVHEPSGKLTLQE
ncbi:MFS permease [Pyrenophora seminiperda CCB06]|uniref:MFS permease n=1 Tax=Pyrenophora seminiperda CCB06 TaxID=1302712 RepID=A0A3M7MB13_9PLEO|nr:MFS permease [Pyrenophora seminiperda CCB06]